MNTADRMWEYANQTEWTDRDLVGYKVEAADGSIGKVDEASTEIGAQRLVVDTGPWIFGQKVMIPAGVVDRVDHQDQRVFITVTQEQVKESPKFDENLRTDEGYRSDVSRYYSSRAGSL